MPGLLGKKIGMTSVFSADGKNVPCTVIEAGPCVVTQVKTVEKDGYAAVLPLQHKGFFLPISRLPLIPSFISPFGIFCHSLLPLTPSRLDR